MSTPLPKTEILLALLLLLCVPATTTAHGGSRADRQTLTKCTRVGAGVLEETSGFAVADAAVGERSKED